MKEPGGGPRRINTRVYYRGPGMGWSRAGDMSPAKTKAPLYIDLYRYQAGRWQGDTFHDMRSCLHETGERCLLWMNINGIPSREDMNLLAHRFQLDEMSIEAVINQNQRPRVDFFDNYYLIILHILIDQQPMEAIQASLFLGSDFLITIQERENEVYDSVRNRLQHNGARIAEMGIDYLGFCACESLVESFSGPIQTIIEELASLEDGIFNRTEKDVAPRIHVLKSRLLQLDRLIWNVQKALNTLDDTDNVLIRDSNRDFFRNAYDYSLQTGHMIDSYRDIATGILEFFMSQNSNQMNEVMKVLTMIATLFIPLTFIAGVYGMNFNTEISPFNMPELNMRFGYFSVCGVMLATVVGMVWFFKSRKWF